MERERIELSLGIGAGVVTSVSVRSTRALGAAQALSQHPLDEALALVPMLFALCGRAHRLAAISAVEDALGVAPDAAVTAGRASLGDAECIEGHARTMLLEWPRVIGERPDVATFARLRREVESFSRAVDPFGVLVRPRVRRGRPRVGAATAPSSEEPRHLAAALRASLRDAALVPETSSEAGLTAWAARGASASARVVRSVLDAGLEGLGASAIPLSREVPVDAIARGLARDPEFAATPTHEGRPVETGPIAEHVDTPLVAAIVARHGRGLLARLVARFAAIDSALAKLEGAEPVLDTPYAEPSRTAGTGIGAAPTSRGRLVHQIALDGAQVHSWRTVAPTEWSFHPDGAVCALLGSPASDAVRRAEWHVVALDPCVPCAVRVEG